MTQITREWLESNGFERDAVMGHIRDMGHLSITVGTFPFNVPRAAVLVGGLAIVPAVKTREDLEALIRLMDGAEVESDG